MQLIMHEIECFDWRINERIASVITRNRESIEDISDRFRSCMVEYDESVVIIVVANNKIVRSMDVHIEEFHNVRNELYRSLEKTKSSEEMRDAQLRKLMKRFNEFVEYQNSKMQRFALGSIAVPREIGARV